mgnify:CR=1 FL=1
MSSDSIVIIPTYNERENVEKMIRKVFSLPKGFHLLIIDDGSPDGTGALADVMAEHDARVHPLQEEETCKVPVRPWSSLLQEKEVCCTISSMLCE